MPLVRATAPVRFAAPIDGTDMTCRDRYLQMMGVVMGDPDPNRGTAMQELARPTKTRVDVEGSLRVASFNAGRCRVLSVTHSEIHARIDRLLTLWQRMPAL